MEAPLEQILQARVAEGTLLSAQDYKNYHHKATARLARTKRALKIQQRPGPKAPKAKTITEDDVAKNPEFAAVPLLYAERAWAAAMETKAVLDTNGSAAKRRHMVSKLNKAFKHAALAASLAAVSDIPKEHKLQMWAYRYLIEGSLRFEQHAWAKAVHAYSAARVLLSALVTIGTDTIKELVGEILSLQVDPSLSYAVYRSQQSRSADIPTFAKQTFDKACPAGELVTELSPRSVQLDSAGDPCAELGQIAWRHHRAATSDPDLAYAILQARKADASLDDAAPTADSSTTDRIGQFDTVLQAWQDAADVAKSVVERLEAQSRGSHDKATQETYIVSTYINFNLLMRRVHRDRGLLADGSDLRTLQDNARILDRVLQSCDELESLPGVHNDDSLYDSLQAVSGYFRARRAGMIARAHALVGNKKAALALWNSANTHINSAKKLTPGDVLESVLTVSELDKAASDVQSNLARIHGLYALDHILEAEAGNGPKPAVAEALDVYPVGSPDDVVSRLVNLNPQLRPVPVKPVFYDIAFNYISYGDAAPTAQAAVRAETPEPASPASSQTSAQKSGFFKSLWGKK